MAEVEVTAEMERAGYNAAYEFPEMLRMRSELVAAVVSAAYRAMRALEPYRSHDFAADQFGNAICKICGQGENGLTMKQYLPCPGPIR